jgi:hypothetical protein
MRSSLDKRRDMARSILPSTSRSARGDITALKRRNRRLVARRLSVSGGPPDDWDDHLDAFDERAYPDAEINQVVGWRRAADKLNHFERWAVAATRDLPLEERLGALRATLPRGLIGDHAVSHLRALPEIDPVTAARRARWTSQTLRASRARAAARAAAETARRAALLRAVLETPGAHRLLNQVMKAAAHPDPAGVVHWRTLAGVHDVHAFLADVARCPRSQTAFDRFLAGPVTPPR